MSTGGACSPARCLTKFEFKYLILGHKQNQNNMLTQLLICDKPLGKGFRMGKARHAFYENAIVHCVYVFPTHILSS